MNIRCIAGVVYFGVAGALCAAPPTNSTNAEAVLSKAREVVTHAKTAADLDNILKELHTAQDQLNRTPGYSAELGNKIPATFQFITQWQNYLAASSAGNWPEAQNALRGILNNQQIEAPTFFPRSEILEKYEETFTAGNKPDAATVASTSPDQVDQILKSIRAPNDEEAAVGSLQRLNAGQQTWDWSSMVELVKAKDDAQAGLPVELNLKKYMNPPIFGDDISRITAMELLVILPHYFGTVASAPPKENETISGYLDRLTTEASAAGNLALLQRVVAVQVAFGANLGGSSLGTRQFLAGLSQEAAGQYQPAVISYENALKDPDQFLPAVIVGERLAAIKAAHPDDFDKGMTATLNPSPADPLNRPGMPAGFPPWMQAGMGGRAMDPRFNQVSVLPIPMTLSIPAQTTPPPPGTK